MLTVDGTALYNLGCQYGTIARNVAGTQDWLVILDFGSPKVVNGEYGTDLFWMGPVTITQIKSAVENFGRGYYICASTDRGSQITVSVGTTNYGTVISSSTSSAYAHGVAWSYMVNDINSWLVNNGYSSQVHVVGGNDIEPAWNAAANSRAWVDGFDSVNLYDYYDFGSADGCPSVYGSIFTCANGWTMDDVWYKAYGTRPGFPIPEIYNTNGYNAKQWAVLSMYSVVYKAYLIRYFGVLTQYNACLESPGQCSGVDNTPATGWLQLYNELKKDSRTFWTPKWSTDMTWSISNVKGSAYVSANTLLAPQASSATTVDQQIAQLSSALTKSGLNAQMKDSLQEKLDNARRTKADQAFGVAHPASKEPASAPAAPQVSDTGFQVGIFDGAGGVIHNWEGTLTNHWQDVIGSDYVIVSAGVRPDDPAQGMLVVNRVAGNRSSISRQFINTPLKSGSVRVTGANGTLLTLQAENGTRFTFDAGSMTFK